MRIRRELLGLEEWIKTMKLVKTYTVPESWENDTKGNTLAIYDLLLKEYVETSATYNVVVAIFENNQASRTNYKADFICATGSSNGIYGGSSGVLSVRNERTNCATGLIATRSLWASQGTVIKIYSAY